MVDWKAINQKISYGRGKEASVLGPPWTVYRIGSAAAGNFLDSAQMVLPSINASYQLLGSEAKKAGLEAEKVPAQILYEITLDNVGYGIKVGDVFLLADTTYNVGYDQVTFSTLDINGFGIAQAAPNKAVIAGRINKIATVFRQAVTVSGDSWSTGVNAAEPLILSGGTFQLGSVGDTPTNLPIGLFFVPRPYGDRNFNTTPGTFRKSGWAAYVPPLPGFHFAENDKIILADGSSYTVVFPGYQETGFSGTYLFLEREGAQTVQ